MNIPLLSCISMVFACCVLPASAQTVPLRMVCDQTRVHRGDRVYATLEVDRSLQPVAEFQVLSMDVTCGKHNWNPADRTFWIGKDGDKSCYGSKNVYQPILSIIQADGSFACVLPIWYGAPVDVFEEFHPEEVRVKLSLIVNERHFVLPEIFFTAVAPLAEYKYIRPLTMSYDQRSEYKRETSSVTSQQLHEFPSVNDFDVDRKLLLKSYRKELLNVIPLNSAYGRIVRQTDVIAECAPVITSKAADALIALHDEGGSAERAFRGSELCRHLFRPNQTESFLPFARKYIEDHKESAANSWIHQYIIAVDAAVLRRNKDVKAF